MPRVTDYSFLAEQYRQHADKVFKRCLIMSGGDAAWAQEVTHDVFIRLMEKSDSLDRSTSLAGWLLTIAYRLCANRLRHERTLWRRVQAVLMSSTETAAPEPESQSDVHALGVKLQSALATLPPKQRAVLVMRHLDRPRLPRPSIARKDMSPSCSTVPRVRCADSTGRSTMSESAKKTSLRDGFADLSARAEPRSLSEDSYALSRFVNGAKRLSARPCSRGGGVRKLAVGCLLLWHSYRCKIPCHPQAYSCNRGSRT